MKRKTSEHAKNVMERDKKCVLCGSTINLVVHHIVPVVDGGTDTMENMTTLCDKHHYLYHNWPKNGIHGTTEMVIRGMDKKAQDGYVQYKAPFGYEYNNRKLVVNEEEAAIVKEVYKAYLQEKSTLKVSKIFKLPRSLVYHILTSETYLGKVKWRDNVIDGAHEPLVDAKTFEDVRRILEKKRKR